MNGDCVSSASLSLPHSALTFSNFCLIKGSTLFGKKEKEREKRKVALPSTCEKENEGIVDALFHPLPVQMRKSVGGLVLF